jgi:ankyrin repeat protein
VLGDEESVKLLLDKGANPKKQAARGMTPLNIAAAEEHEAVVQLLLAAGAGSSCRVEGVEDEELGSPGKGESSNAQAECSVEVEPASPRPESALGGDPEVSQPDCSEQEAPGPATHSRPKPRSRIRNLAAARPPDRTPHRHSANRQLHRDCKT